MQLHHVGSKQRQVRVTHGGVPQRHQRLAFHPLGNLAGGPEFQKAVTHAFGAGRSQAEPGLDWHAQRHFGQHATFHLGVAVNIHLAQELDRPRGDIAPLLNLVQLKPHRLLCN